MAVPMIMPKLEMSQETATVIEWHKQDGDHVEKGEPLLAVETDKVTVDIESPAAGVLAGICVEPQQVVPVTEVIAYILQPGEELPDIPPAHAGGVLEEEVNGQSSTQASAAVTPVAQRLAAARGVDLSTVVGTGTGGRITKADVEVVLALSPSSVPEPPAGKVRATPAARHLARERGVDLAAVAGSGPRGRVQAICLAQLSPEVPFSPPLRDCRCSSLPSVP